MRQMLADRVAVRSADLYQDQHRRWALLDIRLRTLHEGDDLGPIIALMERYGSTLKPGPRSTVTREFRKFPIDYAPPDGAFLLAHDAAGLAIGCVGYRRTDTPGLCELKRLFVLPERRGLGIGRSLSLEAMRMATSVGYGAMILGTFPDMIVAEKIYRDVGFRPAAQGLRTQTEGLLWLEKDLSVESSSAP